MRVVSVLLSAVAVACVGSKPTFAKLVHLYFYIYNFFFFKYLFFFFFFFVHAHYLCICLVFTCKTFRSSILVKYYNYFQYAVVTEFYKMLQLAYQIYTLRLHIILCENLKSHKLL